MNLTKHVVLDFCAQFTRASYINPKLSYNTDAVLSADLAMLSSLGINSTRIDLDYGFWLQNDSAGQSRMSALISTVKQTKRFVLGDAGAELYRGAPILWTDFKAAWISRVKILALFRPFAYIIIKEPGFYAPMISDARTNPAVQDPSEWFALAQTLANAVKAISSSTMIGIIVSTGSAIDMTLLQSFISVPNIDFIGFDIYGQNGYTVTSNFLKQFGSGGKKIWSSEAWSTTGAFAFNPTRADSDAIWIQSHYIFCEQIGAVEMNPFFSDCFASYTWAKDEASILAAYQQRTPVFSAYQKIISG